MTSKRELNGLGVKVGKLKKGPQAYDSPPQGPPPPPPPPQDDEPIP